MNYTDSNKTKEDSPMKKNKYPHLKLMPQQQPLYPNAADSQYYRQKAVDIITGIVSGMGFVSAMVFLVTLS